MTNGTSTSSPGPSAVKLSTGMTPTRVKRVAVTSCDSCRLRKLKCNAKELPVGSSCSACRKHDWACTFEDSKESQKRPAGRMRHKIHRGAGTIQAGLDVQHVPSSAPQYQQSSATAPLQYTLQAAMPGTGVQHRPLAGSSSAAWSVSNVAHADADPYAPIYSWSSGPSASGPRQHSYFDASVAPTQPWCHFTVKANLSASFLAKLALPRSLSDTRTSFTRSVSPLEMIEVLMCRYFADTTSNASLLSRHNVLRQYYTSVPTPLPEYLLQTLLAVAAFLPTTTEPELLAWRQHGWTSAVKAVQNQLRVRAPADLALLQAMLLLGNGWVGNPEDNERSVIYEMAMRLSLSIGLNSSDAADRDFGQRSTRSVLFWTMYITDRLLLVATGRPLILQRGHHDLPLPTAQDATTLALSLREDLSTANEEHIWLHRQLLAFIALADILENTYSVLQDIRRSPIQTLNDIHRLMLPVELALESWCKENKLLLRETAAAHGPLCQHLTESMVAQLHMCQLQLYQAPLRFEIEHAKSLPILFDATNSKSLTACVESAWYLVQQPLVNRDPATAMRSILPENKPVTHFNITNYAVLRAAQFLRLLSCTWAEWNAGHGLEEYTPRNAVEFAVAAQGPWSDANVLQRQQSLATRQHQMIKPHPSLPPEWQYTPETKPVSLPPVEAAAPPPPSNSMIGQAQEWSWQTASSSTSSLAQSSMPTSSQPSPLSSSGAAAASNISQPLAEPSQGPPRARKQVPRPLDLNTSNDPTGPTSGKRKRGVTFIVAENGEGDAAEPEFKLLKLDAGPRPATELDQDQDKDDDDGPFGLSLTMPPRTAKLDTATLESFAFPLTPARFLFDASEIDLGEWDWGQQGAGTVQGAGTSVEGGSKVSMDTCPTNEGARHAAGVGGSSQQSSAHTSTVTNPAGLPLEEGPSMHAPATDSMLALSNLSITPSLGNFGATAAMMTPIRIDYMTALQPGPAADPFLSEGIDLSALGLKGLDGLDPLHGVFSGLSSSSEGADWTRLDGERGPR